MLIRLLFNCSVYLRIFVDHDFTEELCGPLAIPIDTALFQKVITIELAYYAWPFLLLFGFLFAARNSSLLRINGLRTPKVIFILILKLSIIFWQPQRSKYYLIVFIIEQLLLSFTFVFDFMHPKVIYFLLRFQKYGKLLLVTPFKK